MAAGLGFKTFTTGEVLTAADVNGYLMQGILVFADATARDAAITSPQEGQFAFTKDNNSLWYYTGSAWAASTGSGDIEGVTAGVGISGGGTTGTVTVTNSMATAIDAKGDLIVGTGADTFSRLAVGATDGHVLKVKASTSTGLEWAAAGGGGASTFITKNTFSNVANVELQNIFSSSYDNYQVYLEVDIATATDDLIMQMMYSTNTVENNAGYYGTVLSAYTSTSVTSTVGGTQFILSPSSANDGSFIMLNFQNVGNASEFAQWHGTGVSNNEVALLIGGYQTTNRTYTGIKLFSSSSNITGIATVYGLAKS